MRVLIKTLLAMLLSFAPINAWASDVVPSNRVKRSVVIREQPDTRSVAIGQLLPSESLTLVASLPRWYKVRLPDGRIGYVSKSWTIVPAASPASPLSATVAETKVHVIDVGTGLAIFVEGPGFTMLYDAGSQDDLATGAANRVVAYIRAVRPGLTTLDHVVLSHPHKDHLELMPDVFSAFVVKNVWDSGTINRTVGYCKFLKAVAADPGVQYHDAIASGGIHEVTFTNGGCNGTIRVPQAEMMTDRPVPLGWGASMSVLWRDSSPHSDPNENTLVVRLDAGDKRILLAGDAEAGDRQPPGTPPAPTSIEAGLLRCCAAALKADALVVGHHGSMTSSRRAFLDAVGAKLFIVSSGPHPYSGVTLPDSAVIAELATRGRVLRTDIDDEQCGLRQPKVGPDADESPGGCSSILVTLGSLGVTADLSPVMD